MGWSRKRGRRHLSLRVQVWTFVVVVVVGSAALIMPVAARVILDGFSDLDRAEARQETARVVSLLDGAAAVRARTARDWAVWHDARAFVLGDPLGFRQEQLSAPVLERSDLDALVFLDENGNEVAALDQLATSVRRALDGAVARTHEQLASPSGSTGVLVAEDRLWLVAASPITDTSARRPRVTTLVLAEQLDDAEVADLGALLGLQTSIRVVGTTTGFVPLPQQPASVRVASGEDSTLLATATLDGAGPDGPHLEVETVVPSRVQAQAGTSVRRLLLLLFVVSVLAGVVSLLWFERGLLARIGLLRRQVSDAANGRSPHRPIGLAHRDELADLADDVEHTVASLERTQGELNEANARLVASNEELVAADAAKDEFVAVLSHEFRTPLTVIRGFAETLRSHRAQLPPEDTDRLLGRVVAQSRALERMVDDLLVLARATSGRLRVEAQELPAAAALLEVVDDLPDTGGLKVRVEPGTTVRADPDHLRRIVVNLLSNARRYGSEPIEVTAGVEDDRVVLTVRDHGDGVPEAFIPHLFDRFSQAGEADRSSTHGVGLGLHIVRVLAEANRGRVSYEPAAPGARFRVELPAGSRPEPREPTDAAPQHVGAS